jgi:tryptophan synthase alpha chain
MNRIDELFKRKQQRILSVYFSAGFPKLNDTVKIIKELEKNRVDMIEIGMPFSDPMADGPVIQHSNQIALDNGMNLELLFDQLKDIRDQSSIPLILMGYTNPVMQFGIENFCKKCHETGIDGIILPDLPVDEFNETYKPIFKQYGLHKIFLVSPHTSQERLKKLTDASTGFVYFVSSSSTTGAKNNISGEQETYFKKIKELDIGGKPKMIGFGISNNETFEKACAYAHGAIIGSAFIKALSGDGSIEDNIKNFAKMILKG